MKKISEYLILISMVMLLSTASSLKAISKDDPQRKQLFDSNWKFYLGDAPAAKSIGYDDKNWRILDLPHDWSIEGVVDVKNPSGNDGGYFPAGIGWYRKTFNAPSSWKGKCVSIYFEGVYMNSEVFINGKSLGIHPYGYTTFSYDLTSDINLGKDNLLSVKVDNSQQKNCRWYSGSGIYRHVWIVVTDPVHVPLWGVSITTPDISAEKASVLVKTKVKNETAVPQNITINTVLTGDNSKNAGDKKSNLLIQANSEQEVEQTIQVADPLLWSPEKPQLYKAQIQIIKSNTIVDEVNTSFGIRSIKYSAEIGFQLNGKSIEFNGGCVHHDNGCLGTAAFDRAEERRVELLKAGGFNSVRTSHNPPSEAFLNACDKLGLLVIDEAFDGWRDKKTNYDYALVFDAWWKRDIEAMVLRDRNHPSIVMWSIGNEIIERKKPEAVETAKMLADGIRKIDNTRPITSAMTTWDGEWNIFDPLMAVHDICGYNYQLQRAASDHIRVPSRLILSTESYPTDAFKNWKMAKNNSYILGDFVWTSIDYLGESGIGRWFYPGDVTGEHWENPIFPWHGAYCGDIDLIGWRKPISHYRSMLYNENEKLYMAVKEPNPESGPIKLTSWAVWPTWESWTWPGYEGKEIQVEIYSKYPKVRLYLNKVLIGEKATTEEEQFKATFSLPFSKGELKAVGVADGKEIESKVLNTSGKTAKIRLVSDRKVISADGQDLSFVTIEITDNDGIFQPNAENLLNFKIEGSGVIAGVDNANIKDSDPYVATSRKAWHGRALVVIRSSKKPGQIKLSVSSEGLSDSSITIGTIEK
jgi:beta-galactosidase